MSVPAWGGDYAEGIIGQPMYVNPLLAQSNETDADLVQLVYAGLFRYDRDGQVVGDLTERFEISEDQKTYTVYLRQDVFWHDGEKFTAEDVKFTADILQNPTYKSLLRQNWQGVAGVRQVDEYTVEFSLNEPYFGFLGTLTVGIMPKHIWENVTPEKFLFSDYNLKPVGCGPYAYVKSQKNAEGDILSFDLTAFPKYHRGEPFISRLVVNFYPDESSVVSAYNKREVRGIGNLPLEYLTQISSKSISVHEITIPRYFSVFLNQKTSVPIASKEVRQALSFAVNREAIIGEVLQGKGTPTYSPILPQMKEYNSEVEQYRYDVERAKSILEEAGWKLNAEKNLREKDGQELRFNLYTTDWPELSMTADVLKSQWEAIGVKVEVQKLTVSDIQQNHIRPRDYDALLVGQAITFDPDMYSFWHSSQKQDAGFNLALFDNKQADKILEEVRVEPSYDNRLNKHRELQKIFSEEVPAVFLYSPYYLYPVDSSVKGFEAQKVISPAWRFSDVNQWYVRTKRVRK